MSVLCCVVIDLPCGDDYDDDAERMKCLPSIGICFPSLYDVCACVVQKCHTSLLFGFVMPFNTFIRCPSFCDEVEKKKATSNHTQKTGRKYENVEQTQ